MREVVLDASVELKWFPTEQRQPSVTDDDTIIEIALASLARSLEDQPHPG